MNIGKLLAVERRAQIERPDLVDDGEISHVDVDLRVLVELALCS